MSKLQYFEAAEILSSGICPLTCKYCYIPKTPEMKLIHEKIIANLQDDTTLNVLKKVYGDNLRSLGFWGTEPTLTLPIIQSKLTLLKYMFPNLEDISFSTSMLTSPKLIFDFILALIKTGFNLEIQVSLDGPDFITDVNRIKGASKKVPANLFSLLRELQTIDLKDTKLSFHFKATISIENIRYFNKYPEKLIEYKEYFMDLEKTFDEINSNKNITFKLGSWAPSLVVPGKYTTEDGKAFNTFVKNQKKFGVENSYIGRLLRLFQYTDELGTRRYMFTCSGGRSNLGIGDEVHLCHRSFYLNDEKYIHSILASRDMENWDISLFRAGSIDNIRKKFIIDSEDVSNLRRFSYVMRGHHDFWRFNLSTVKVFIQELALAEQIDSVFLSNDELSTLFALFLTTALSCPMENLLNTGSVFLTPLSLIRLFGNGAFVEILRGAKDVLQKSK